MKMRCISVNPFVNMTVGTVYECEEIVYDGWVRMCRFMDDTWEMSTVSARRFERIKE